MTRLRLLLAGVIALGLSACGGPDTTFHGPTRLRSNLVPATVSSLQITRVAPKLEKDCKQGGGDALDAACQVYLVSDGTTVQGSIEIYLVKSDVRADDSAILAGLDGGLGGRVAQRVRLVPQQIVWLKEGIDQRVYYWNPPLANALEIVTLRKQFSVHRDFVTALVDYQQGLPIRPFAVPTEPPPTPQSQQPLVDYGGAANPTQNPQNPPAPQLPSQPTPTPSSG